MPWPCLTPGERTPSIHWIGGWVGLTAGLDTEATWKYLCLCQRLNPSCPVVKSVIGYYTDWATPAPTVQMFLFILILKCERGRGLFLGTIPADKENTKEQVMLSKCLETWPLSLYYSMSLHMFAKSTANWHACSSYTKFTLPMGQRNVTVPLRGSATLP
jgi:hypothetical protein